VSPRRLAGWEPAEVTFYEYEGDRLVASVAVREPAFSKEDVAILLASRRADSEPRNGFGVLLSEATDRKKRYEWNAEPETDFVVESVHRVKQARLKGDPEADASEWVWRVTRPQ
jgi:hypothetical protein